MRRKIFGSHSSLAITLPINFTRILKMKKGDYIDISIDKQRGRIIIDPVTHVDTEIIKWVDEFVSTHKEELEDLAKPKRASWNT